MRKRTKNLLGALFLITAIIIAQIPEQDVTAASTSSSDFIYQENTLVQYTGTDSSVSVPASVKKIGNNAFSGDTTLKSIIIPDSVEEIGDAAFSNCTNLDSVTVEGTLLQTFGDGVFAGCDSLTDVSFEDGASFVCEDGAIYNQNKTKLYEYLAANTQESFSIPDSVTELATFAFWGSDSLKNVTIPDSLDTISAYAFASCNGIENITIPSTVKQIDMKAFADCVNLQNVSMALTTKVADNAFEGSTKLNSSDIQSSEYEDTSTNTIVSGDSISGNDVSGNQPTGTSESTEQDDQSGFSFTIPASGESLATTKIVGQKAVLFIDNTKQTVLSGAYIPPSIETGMTADTQVTSETSQGDSTDVDTQSASLMQNISNALTNSDEKGVSIPKYTSYNGTIAQQAFYRNDTVTSYEFPDGITQIGDFAFARSALKEIDIPSGVTHIGYAAFYHADDLLTVTIPSTVTEIEPYAFDHTAWLDDWENNGSSDYLIVGDGILLAYRGSGSKIVIPDGVKHIAAYVFSEHQGITSVICPSSLESVGESAFEDCSNLVEVSFNEGISKVADRAFAGCPIKNIEIPESVQQIGLGAFDQSSLTSDGSNTITLEGDDLPMVSYEKSAERLSNSDDRVLALNGITYALITNNAANQMENTIMDSNQPGFQGIIFTPDAGLTQTVLPVLEITDGENQIALPDTITSKGITYQVEKNYYTSEGSAFQNATAEASVTSEIDGSAISPEQVIRVSNLSDTLGRDNVVTATIDGNSTNYNLRITDSEESNQILQDGYLSAYGNALPDNCISFDAALYDDSGIIPITKLGKQSIKITFTLPDSLQENGSLHVITADQDGQLEELDYEVDDAEDGSRMITIETSHFSPIGLYEYVSDGTQTARVSNGIVTFTDGSSTLDQTPDTGDLIAPKWFLAAGFFFLSLVFFLMPGRKKGRLKNINFN